MAPFSVFVDPRPAGATHATAKPDNKSANVFQPINKAPSLATVLSTSANKENLDPLTGERSTGVGAAAKKRKTSALAVKACSEGGSSENASAQPVAKKRKGSTSSGTALKPKAAKKGKKVTKKRSGSPLPKVDEEGGEAVVETLNTPSIAEQAQAVVDARCYELTVAPLADVSAAYEATIFGSPAGKSTPYVRDASAEPQIRDYFSLNPDFTGSRSGRSRERSASVEPKVFSTPERKQIYSTFTFTSPSPSSKALRDSSPSTRAAEPASP